MAILRKSQNYTYKAIEINPSSEMARLPLSLSPKVELKKPRQEEVDPEVRLA